MKQFYFLLIAILIAGKIMAAPFTNLPYTILQADGTTIECFVSGDEFFNWIHDKQGYPIIEGTDGFYYYAIPNNDGFIASKYKANHPNPSKVGIVKMQDIDINLIKKIVDKARKNLIIPEKPIINSKTEEKSIHLGDFNNLVIYIRFANEENFMKTRKEYDNSLNLPEGFSLKSYYWEVSYNQLIINSTHYPPVDNPETQNFSYQDSHPRNYFMPYSQTNTIGYSNNNQRTQREHQLLVDAVNWVNENCPVPTDLNIDMNNDGYVDNVCFMIRGNSGAWNDLLWAHRWSLFSFNVQINGKRVYDYTFEPENQVDVTTLCHEMFHVLGAPDLYHYNYGTDLNPAGPWDLMQSGAGHMLTYMKWKYAQKNWVKSIPEITQAGRYTLAPITHQNGNCYKIASPYSNNQFFMVEYRKKDGEFESRLPSEGMLVYRINTNFNGNASYDGNTQFDEVYVYRPGGTTAVNGSINTATFSANSGRTAINDFTNPSSFLVNGSDGGLNIYDISTTGDSISFSVSFEQVIDYTLTVVADPVEGGNPTGGGQYAPNTQVTVKANPNQGWKFLAWVNRQGNFLSGNPTYKYKLTVFNDTIKAIYQELTAIENVNKNCMIYPNPAENVINIESLEDIKQIKIFGINGNLLRNYEMVGQNIQIDISDLSSGIFWIEIRTNENVVKFNKFIKM